MGNTPLNRTRALEWCLSTLMLAWGVNILSPEVFFDLPVYKLMRELMSESRWGMAAVLVALLRMTGLAINGWWRRSPLIRLAGSGISGAFWLTIGFLMWGASINEAGTVRLPAGILWYVVFIGYEGWCVLSCGYDMQKNGSLEYGAKPRYVTR